MVKNGLSGERHHELSNGVIFARLTLPFERLESTKSI
jgi:hypothetical protein